MVIHAKLFLKTGPNKTRARCLGLNCCFCNKIKLINTKILIQIYDHAYDQFIPKYTQKRKLFNLKLLALQFSISEIYFWHLSSKAKISYLSKHAWLWNSSQINHRCRQFYTLACSSPVQFCLSLIYIYAASLIKKIQFNSLVPLNCCTMGDYMGPSVDETTGACSQ